MKAMSLRIGTLALIALRRSFSVLLADVLVRILRVISTTIEVTGVMSRETETISLLVLVVSFDVQISIVFQLRFRTIVSKHSKL